MSDEREVQEELNEKIEGLPEGVTITSRNDHNIRKTIGKVIIFVAFVGVLVGAYLFGNSSIPENNQSMSYVINREAPFTVLDEAIANYESEHGEGLVSRIDYYEDLINVSETLHGFELSSITEGLDKYEVPNEINLEDINEDIDKFEAYLRKGVSDKVLSKDSEDFVRLALKLEAEEKAVNCIIQGSAFNDLANFKILLLKSKVADCCEFPAEAVDHMLLTSYSGEQIMKYCGETGKEYTIRFSPGSLDLITSCNLIPEIVSSTFADQSYSATSSYEYNEDTNKRLQDEINTAKTFVKMECSINDDGKLVLNAPVAIQRFAHVFRKSEEKSN